MTALKKYIGDTWTFPVQLFNDVAQTQPKNMTGYTVAGDFYKASDSTPITLTVGSGLTLIDLSQGNYSFEVDPDMYTGVVSIDPLKVTPTTKFGTRLRVYDTSPAGIILTRGIILIMPAAI